MPGMMSPEGQAVLLEDAENPWIDDIEGYDRFQRTAPAIKGPNNGPIENHVYATNPRKPNAGKQYIPIRYQHQDFPMAVYSPRVIASREVSMDLETIAKSKDKDRQPAWDAFLDRLVEIELSVDFRQLALPELVPDPTAIRMLRRTLILQIQAAESEVWITKNHPKTYADYQVFVKSPNMQTVRSSSELKSLGRGWYRNPNCAPETEVNIK
jgi:hypothetical protein